MKKYVTYRRVSTSKQGESGLGLEAQDRDIQLYLDNYSKQPFKVVGEYVEVQSGGDSNRPKLTAAIAKAKAEGAELLIAKLDRLSRKVSFIAALMDDKKLSLRVANMPEADNFQLHIYAALAEQERKFVSVRTKAAMAVAKAQGRVFGGLRDKTMKRNEEVKRRADLRAQRVADLVLPLRQTGKTMQQIANALTEANVPTARGGQWSPSQVLYTLRRLEAR